MKADEIRKQPDELLTAIGKEVQAATSKEEGIQVLEKGLQASHLWCFSEIAAQIAETNEKLNIILNPTLKTARVQGPMHTDLDERAQFAPWQGGQPVEDQMTMRDQFAMAAMQGCLSTGDSADEFWVKPESVKATAKQAYQWADEMMEARK